MSAIRDLRAARRIVVVGDVILDRDVSGDTTRLCPDAPVPVVESATTREGPGGAGLAALLCAGPGLDTSLVAPIADDEPGERLAAALRDRVGLVGLPHAGQTRRKTRVRARGQTLVRLDEGGPGTPTAVPVGDLAALLSTADAVLVSDYGAGTAADPALRDLLAAAAARVPLVWDPHPRGRPPVPGATVATPNRAEAAALLAAAGRPVPGQADELAAAARDLWRVDAVCLTDGERGAWLAAGGPARLVPAEPSTGDSCGAGDRLAAALTVSLATGRHLGDAAVAAVGEATAWVAAGGTSGYRERSGKPPLPQPTGGARRVASRVRAAGGTLVATGGCFDLLHAGHVAGLTAARRLGDALVVLLNSDQSVRRLKGPDRPLMPAADRARLLAALRCVDAVEIFDGTDPADALARLRPDVWTKGADYGDPAALPETPLVRSWGGRVVLLPYLPGRSSSAILAAARGVDRGRDVELDLDLGAKVLRA